MLPVCSTTCNYYSHSQVCLHGGYHKVKCVMKEGGVWRLSNNKIQLLQGSSFRTQSTNSIEQLKPLRFADEATSSLPMPASDSLNMNNYSEYLPKRDVFAGINESLSALVCNTDTAITNSLKTLISSVELVDTTLSKLNFSLSSAMSGLFNNSKGVSTKVGFIIVDALRHGIITVEEFLTQGATLLVYAYASTKDMLPPELQNVLNSSQDKALYILRPVGSTLQQVYLVLEGFERRFGIDPNDPIVPFVLVLGTSATLWVSYWTLTYGGYAGDLSPKLTFELLNGKESAVLVDVRPEDFIERDGIPDLRRTARSRYTAVSLPEVDANVKKLIKSGKDLDDALVAAVIQNLKIVQDRSKVIVMDADGNRSKRIARSLKKLGVETPYLVQGGFRSWVQEGLRVKELKPETTLSILSEEAEAILEDATPLQVLGYGVGFLAAAYALLEWEKTLQFIALVGLGQTLYRRLASYEDSKDFNRDVSQLLVPVKLGGQAISWAAGKLETNRNGLPTSPSSVNVQNRVLQAAAKHESQPSDSEDMQDSSPDSTTPLN